MKTVIEINGKQYDTRTGKVIRDSAIDRPNIKISDPLVGGTSIDGFSRRRPHKAPQIDNLQKPQKMAKSLPQQHHSTNITLSNKRTQKANTLLRKAVKKPNKIASGLIHSSVGASTGDTQRGFGGRGFILKRSVQENNIKRANQIVKDGSVSRFGNVGLKTKPKLSNFIKVVKQPQSDPALAATPIIGQQLPKAVFKHSSTQNISKRTSSKPKDKLGKRLVKGFKLKGKALSISAACLSVLLLGGFFAYQNIPSVAMRVAASRAGFNGRIPGNIPAGYAFKSPINYSKSFISIKYQSNSDDRKFLITQKPTEWSSESLLTNYLVTSKLRYQTYHDKGLTVYIYNEGSATWVDKGVWFNISGEGSLSSDQILAIAGSM